MTAPKGLQRSDSEDTSLLPRRESVNTTRFGKRVIWRLLLCGFFVALSFGVTQVPLIYVFRVMTCSEYYKDHPEPSLGVDRCNIPAIESSTAKAVAILGFSTTLFGVPNLFLTSWTIKKWGIKKALLIQVSWVAIRLLIQNAGVEVGNKEGIIIIQCSQIITIIGGPNGYLLALNSFISEVVTPSERTASLGRLQGFALFGSAIGFMFGGLFADWFDIKAPFRVALLLFMFCSLYVFTILPYTPVDPTIKTRASQGVAKFFGPLRKFAPQKWVLRDGTIQTEYGALLLGIGVFFGILATGYITILLQMYSTDVLGFGPKENGALVSVNFLLRGLFLTVAFPRIIATGRKWLQKRDASPLDATSLSSDDVPTESDEMAAIDEAAHEPLEPVKSKEEHVAYDFDLFYCKFSLILDGIITGTATFVRQGWQMYLVAILIPFAAGTGSSSKGTILQMCSASERVDALSGITLIEMIARLSTTSLFGLVYAAFTSVGKPYLVFTVNAGVAVLGFVVLLFSRFPPKGSKRLESPVDEHQEPIES